TQISSMHIHVLRWLGERYDLRLYHLNPLLGRLAGLPASRTGARVAMQALAQRFRAANTDAAAGDELVHAWGHAAAESLWQMGELLAGERSFHLEAVVPTSPPQRPAVLPWLQDVLLHGQAAPGTCLQQDRTVQI